MRMSPSNKLLTEAAIILVAMCATTQAHAQIVRLNDGFAPDPVTLRGVAGGTVEASTVAESCRGFIPTRPQHQIVTTGLPRLRVFTTAANDADVTLAIVTPDRRIFCDDDSGGSSQALLDLQLPAGTYSIFVGTYASGENAPYTLVLTRDRSLDPSNFRPSNVAIVANNVPANNGNAGSNGGSSLQTQTTGQGNAGNNSPPADLIEQAAKLQPIGSALRLRNGGTGRVRGRTGGTTSTSTLFAGCAGFIHTAPSHRVTIERAGLPIQFRVTSASDTTLLIRAPNGQVRCDDDAGGGLNPMVLFPSTVPGTYTVWVGTYRPGLRNLYQLSVTTSIR